MRIREKALSQILISLSYSTYNLKLSNKYFSPFVSSSPVVVSSPALVALDCVVVGGEVVGGDESQLYKLSCL